MKLASLLLLAPLMMALTAPAPDANVGPDLVVMDELVNLFEPVRFDHAVHADMLRLGDGCVRCHHQQALDTQPVRACRDCHPADAATVTATAGSTEMLGLRAAYHRQCLSCHSEWRGAKACTSCHAERRLGAAASSALDPAEFARRDRTDPSAVNRAHRPFVPDAFVYDTGRADHPFVTFQHADHTARFGVTCIECHRAESCATCHGPGKATAANATLAGATSAHRAPIARAERCFTCHGEQRCALCHDEKPRPRFDHTARTGFTLGAHHETSACTECHGAPQDFTVPSTRSCIACHAGMPPERFDHAVTGVPLSGSHAHFECTRCHDARHETAPPTCSMCHPDRTYPEQWPGREVPPVLWRDAIKGVK